MSGEPDFRLVGSDAVLVDFGTRARAAAAYRLVRDLLDADDATVERPRDVVPAATTVLLDGVGGAAVDGWRHALAATALDVPAPAAVDAQGEMRTIQVRYDGSDLGEVASAWGCSIDEVADRHQAAVFTVAFCGFAPGFAYCTAEPALADVPRRASPRPRVPAGSVALAGPYCGVYPRATPGGWQLVGTTDAVLFDADRERPALLAPGDRVRFEAR